MGPHSSSPRSRVMSASSLPLSVDGRSYLFLSSPVKHDTRVITPPSKPNIQIQLVPVFDESFFANLLIPFFHGTSLLRYHLLRQHHYSRGEKRRQDTFFFREAGMCTHTRELPMTELRKVSTGASNSTTSDICIAHEPGPTVYII